MPPCRLLALDRDSLLRVLALCSTRDVLALACCNQELHRQLQDDELWRLLAEQKWGRHVVDLARVEKGGWAAWTRHRLAASNHPASPLDLEQYQDCPFQHIAACLLCSRTTGGAVVRTAIHRFLALFPTPSAVLDAPDASMLEVVQPLGLQAVRLAAVRGVARDFLAADWHDPCQFKHCGPFVAHSWRIFCRGDLRPAGVQDKALLRYLRWRSHGSTDGGASPPERQRAGGRGREAAAEAGTMRSGRRRGGGAARAAKRRRSPVPGDRRVTRAAAAGCGI